MTPTARSKTPPRRRAGAPVRTKEVAAAPVRTKEVAADAPTSNETPPAVVAPTTGSFAVVPIDRLSPGANPRRNLGDLDGLTASIRAVGVQQPLLVKPAGGGRFEVVAGHRRLASAGLAGLAEIPCYVRAFADEKTQLEAALIENIQREELDPLDEAQGYKDLAGLGLSQRTIGERVGRSQSHISKRLGLLELPADVQKRVQKGTLPLESAAALLRLKDHPKALKEVAGRDPSTITYEVERAEKRIAVEAKIAELTALAEGKGWKVVTAPPYGAKRTFKTLDHWNGPPELAVDAKAHAAEPCQGIMVPSSWDQVHGAPKAVTVCLDPARHGPKGGSALKVAKPPKRELTTWEQKDRQEDKDRKAAAGARAAVLAPVLADHKATPTRGKLSPEVSLCLRILVHQVTDPAALTACELLGAVAANPKNAYWPEVLRRYAAAGADELHRGALAVAMATAENRLRSSYHGFGDGDLAYYGYLVDLGYEPAEWERSKLAAAADQAQGGEG